jgi:hypothetical protein
MSVLVLCKVTMPAFDIFALLRGKLLASQWNFGWFMPDWWPKISWPWFVFVGSAVTLSIAVLFRTPAIKIAAAEAHVAPNPKE